MQNCFLHWNQIYGEWDNTQASVSEILQMQNECEMSIFEKRTEDIYFL